MRLLLLVIIGYFCYRKLKSFMTPESLRTDRMRQEVQKPEPSDADDLMIQDPWCGVYFPQNSSVVLVTDGKEFRFCSTACRDAYLNRLRGNDSKGTGGDTVKDVEAESMAERDERS